MTQEEKAKAYDEALERARNAYQNIKPENTAVKAMLEKAFPELTESEDEKIRREIIDFIQWAEERGMTRHDYHQAKKPAVWITYLEKQKEPLTPEEKMKHPLYVEGFDAGKQVGTQYEAAFGKQKEQKPTPDWSDNFEENIRNLLDDKLTWHSEDGSMSSTVLIDDKTLKDIVQGIWFYVGKEAFKYPSKELNVTEWNERDKKILDLAIQIIDKNIAKDSQITTDLTRSGLITRNGVIRLLKTLRPQPKQKDRFWEGYIKGLSEARKPPFNIEDWLTEKEEADEQDKQPHWKPSEEQMTVLSWAARGMVDKSILAPELRAVLQELHNDLMKLK